MPRFFFDVVDNGKRYPDVDGTVLADLEHAREEALETLGQIAKDELPDGDQRELAIDVRTDAGQILLTASLSLLVQRRVG
jgi:hypothetical protein